MSKERHFKPLDFQAAANVLLVGFLRARSRLFRGLGVKLRIAALLCCAFGPSSQVIPCSRPFLAAQ
jgi:hypothetical protein